MRGDLADRSEDSRQWFFWAVQAEWASCLSVKEDHRQEEFLMCVYQRASCLSVKEDHWQEEFLMWVSLGYVWLFCFIHWSEKKKLHLSLLTSYLSVHGHSTLFLHVAWLFQFCFFLSYTVHKQFMWFLVPVKLRNI